MKSKPIQFIVLLIFIGFQSLSQPTSESVSVMFYNVENLFDLNDNPDANDDNFTPDGDLYWTYKRLTQKLLNISKVILSASGWSTPEIVALCEIENREVLELLINKTPLKTVPYKIIHKQSPDHRGIDVAMLYNAENFYPVEYQYYPLLDADSNIMQTRETLYVCGIMNSKDTLHLFINHWPSRYSGIMETKGLRSNAAKLLRSKVDDLERKYVDPKIIILGDFNDNPNNESLLEGLGAVNTESEIQKGQLYNLSFGWMGKEHGTMKYQSQWSVFDQIIVSGSIISATSGYRVKPEDAKVVTLPFLFMKDERYGGVKLFRTYYGFTYQGGFSDHLPVLLQMKAEN